MHHLRSVGRHDPWHPAPWATRLSHRATGPSGAPLLDRRRFLLGAGALGVGAVLLPACAGDDGDDGADDRYLVSAFPDGFRTPAILVAGLPARAPMVVVDQLGPLTRDAPETIELTLSTDAGEVGRFTVERHGDGLAVPYYPLRFTPGAAGVYRAQASFSDLPVEFQVVAPGETQVIQVGEALRPVLTPTAADDRGVTPMCTRPEPCPLHAVTVTEALERGGPVALYIGTPAFCQTAVCGPILEFLLEERAARGDAITMIHAEVYRDPYATEGDLGETTEVIDVYGLDFEPQLVVAGADGIVTAVLNNSMDRAEVAQALDAATA